LRRIDRLKLTKNCHDKNLTGKRQLIENEIYNFDFGKKSGVEFPKLLRIILLSFLRQGYLILVRLPLYGIFTSSVRHPIQNINGKNFAISFVNTAPESFAYITNRRDRFVKMKRNNFCC